MVSDRTRRCGLMYNIIIQLITTMMMAFNVAKDKFVVLCSTASTKVAASPLSISSSLCVSKLVPYLLLDACCETPSSST
jgi:hypothetical protein